MKGNISSSSRCLGVSLTLKISGVVPSAQLACDGRRDRIDLDILFDENVAISIKEGG